MTGTVVLRAVCWWMLVGGLGMPGGLRAQVPAPSADSLRSYELAEIVIEEPEPGRVAAPTGGQRIRLAEIARQEAVVVADLARIVPGAAVQTNSRGETLLYLRGAGERQVAFFFDGALLNVPWDYRVDLALVPASVVGGLTVEKGAASLLYGPNVLGGALHLTSRALAEPGRLTEIEARYGSVGDRAEGSVAHFARRGRVGVAVAGGWSQQAGEPVAATARLPYHQGRSDLRLNTDRRLANGFARVAYEGSRGRLGLSLLHLDGAQGVAPEGHVPPEEARFWRYPRWRTSMVVANGTGGRGGVAFRATAWASRFEQTIHAFRGPDYAFRTARQDDRDLTLGSRVALARTRGPGRVRLVAGALTSAHRQEDARGGDPARTRHFRQHTLNAGGEYEVGGSGSWRGLMGAGLDALLLPRTDDQAGREALTALSLTGGVTRRLGATTTLRVQAGRKARFPTLRELFDDGLGRFALNPALAPETAWLGEAGLRRDRERLSGELVVFSRRTSGTIDQRRRDGRRTRVNLEGSRTWGVELMAAARPHARLRLDGHLTALRQRAVEGGARVRLVERPAWLGTLTVGVRPFARASLLVQPTYTGGAYGLAPDGALEPLPAALAWNGRAGYRFTSTRPRMVVAEMFVHVDNLTDTLVLPQPGLPEPGRSLRLGLDLSF